MCDALCFAVLCCASFTFLEGHAASAPATAFAPGCCLTVMAWRSPSHVLHAMCACPGAAAAAGLHEMLDMDPRRPLPTCGCDIRAS